MLPVENNLFISEDYIYSIFCIIFTQQKCDLEFQAESFYRKNNISLLYQIYASNTKLSHTEALVLKIGSEFLTFCISLVDFIFLKSTEAKNRLLL